MDIFLPMLTLGLVTSVHCISMCGPMVVSYAVKGTEGGTAWQRTAPNLAYQAAKIASYMAVGLVLGAIGSAFDLDSIRPYVLLAAGAFMIVLALGMTGIVPQARRLSPRPPRALVRAFTSVRRRAAEDAESGRTSLVTPVTFGLLTGLMPCAPLMAAQLNAAASGSALDGALAMLAFGLGTAPLMLAFGTASSLVPARVKERVMVVLAVVVLVFGVTYLNRGAMLLGSPVTLQAARDAVLGPGEAVAAQSYTVAADGVVELPLAIENTAFVPAIVEVPADRPVRLIVDRRESSPCSDQLAVPQLGVIAELAPNGTTIVDLPAASAGSYTLTCGMGMMSGTLRVGEPSGAEATADDRLPTSAGSGGIACACGSGADTSRPGGAGGESSDTSAEGAAVIADGVQRITVDTSSGRFQPSVVRLAAGVPAEITFTQAGGCLAEVVSSDLGFYADLTGRDQVVRLTADQLAAGTYGFSCGMQMVFGTIIVE